MSPHETALRRLIDQAWNRGHLAVVDEIVAAGYSAHDPTMAREPAPDGFKKVVELFRAAFPDLRYSIEDVIEAGDRIALRFVAAGSHGGEFLGIPPTGRAVEIQGIAIYRFESGRIVEGWFQWDALGLMRQLGGGMAPPGRGAAAKR
jgi:steroid delta-isomerase-like uncharacterized protein